MDIDNQVKLARIDIYCFATLCSGFNMYKIRVLHTEWSDGWGGQEIRILNEMLAVRARGVEVFLACREGALIQERAIEQGIPVFTLPFRGNADLVTLFRLIKLIRKNKIDIVNTHSGKDTWVGGLAARLAGAKFIRTRHLSNPIRSSRTNFINELAHFIFTTGESVRADMIERNRIRPERILSVPTGINADRFAINNFDRNEIRKELGISDDEVAVGIIAVLRQFKRHDLFVEAADRLLNEFPNLKFLIAGDGPVRSWIEEDIAKRKLEERVSLLGHVIEPAKVMAALDIFALSSDSKEGVPQSVMQALLMGLPVVATAAGSTSDLLQDDNFILVEPGNAEALYQGMRKLVESAEVRNSYSEKARSYIAANFSESVMVERILAVYRSLTGKEI
jgi:glycosyltransferase involved in cell wall biosynthesis